MKMASQGLRSSLPRFRCVFGLLILGVCTFRAACQNDATGAAACQELVKKQGNEYIADADAVDAVGGDIQRLVDCVDRNGALFFDVDSMELTDTLNLRQPLHLGHKDTGQSRLNVLCPQNAPAIGIRSKGVSLSGMSFTGCNLKGSAIISISPGSRVSVEDILFANNKNEDGPACIDTKSADVTIRNCTFLGNRGTDGGAMRLQNDTVISIVESNFTENNAINNGGAIFAGVANVTITSCDFLRNEGNSGGGAVWLEENSLCTVVNTTFQNNDGFNGGAMTSITGSQTSVEDSIFLNNTGHEGGAVLLLNNFTTFTARNTLFQGNKGDRGGAIRAEGVNISVIGSTFLNNAADRQGGGVKLTSGGHFTAINTTLQNNRASSGGALSFLNRVTISLHNVKFLGNSAINDAGTIFGSGIDITVTACTFHNNTANGSGGVLVLADEPTSCIIDEQCTFTENSAKTAGVIAVKSSEDRVLNIIVQNSIFSRNKALKQTGGALQLVDYVNATLKNIQFDNNIAAAFGGALHGVGRIRVKATNVTFLKNRAILGGGGGYFTAVTAPGVERDGDMVLNFDGSSFIRNSAGVAVDEDAISATCTNGVGGSIAVVGNGAFLEMQESQILNGKGCTGGGIFWRDGSSLILDKTKIIGNKASSGGGLHAQFSALDAASFALLGTQFTENSARIGGAVRLVGPSRNQSSTASQVFPGAADFKMITFKKNRATDQGGAIAISEIELDCTDCALQQNSAGVKSLNRFRRGSGGAIAIGKDGLVVLSESNLADNAAERGGGIFVNNGGLRCKSVSFANNKALDIGGAVALQYTTPELSTETHSMRCTKCNVTENQAGMGGGIYLFGEALPAKRQGSKALKGDKPCVDNGDNLCRRLLSISEAPREPLLVLKEVSGGGNEAEVSGDLLFANDLGLVDWCCDGGCSRIGVDVPSLPCIKEEDFAPEGNAVDRKDSGRLVSSTVTRIDFNPGKIDGHRSGQTLDMLVVTLEDALGQVVVGDNASITVAANVSGTIFGAPTRGTQLGGSRLNGSEITLRAKPGTYELEFSVSSGLLGKRSIIASLLVTVRTCGDDEESVNDGLTCLDCDSQQFNFDPNGRCKPCPDNADCSRSTLVPVDGFWHPHSKFVTVKRCLNKEACSFGGRSDGLSHAADIAHLQGEVISWQNGSYRQCRNGYTGPLCGSCTPDFGTTGVMQCGLCPEKLTSLALIVVSVGVQFLLSVFLTRNALSHGDRFHSVTSQRTPNNSTPPPLQSGGSTMEETAFPISMREMATGDASHVEEERTRSRSGQEAPTRPAANRTTELFKILLNFLQVVGTAAAINTKWTDSVFKVLSVADLFSGVSSGVGLDSLECAFDRSNGPRSIQSFYFQFLLPFGIWLVFSAHWGIRGALRKLSRKQVVERMLVGLLVILYVSYITIAEKVVRTLNCEEVDLSTSPQDEKETSVQWVADTLVGCRNGPHKILVFAVAVPLLVGVCVGFPLGLIVELIRNKNRLHDADIVRKYGFLYGAYKPSAIFWEVTVLMRKGALGAVTVLSNKLSAEQQGTLVMLILITALLLHKLYEPYDESLPMLNLLETWSLFISQFTFLSGSMFPQYGDVPIIQVILSIFVISLVLGFALYLVYQLFVCGSQSLEGWLKERGLDTGDDWHNIKAALGYACKRIRECVENAASQLHELLRREK